jgi:hypothetical protein
MTLKEQKSTPVVRSTFVFYLLVGETEASGDVTFS